MSSINPSDSAIKPPALAQSESAPIEIPVLLKNAERIIKNRPEDFSDLRGIFTLVEHAWEKYPRITAEERADFVKQGTLKIEGYVKECKQIGKPVSSRILYLLGSLYLTPFFSMEDHKKGLEYLGESRTELGEYILGVCKIHGLYGQPKNEEINSPGIPHLERASKAGYLEATLYLARFYSRKSDDMRQTSGFDQNILRDLEQKAISHWQSFRGAAVDQKDADKKSAFIEALYHLGLAFYEGRGNLTKDLNQGRQEMLRAANYGFTPASQKFKEWKEKETEEKQVELDEKFKNMTKNEFEVLKRSYQKHTLEGDPSQAEYFIGRAYCEGKFVKKDLSKGIRILKERDIHNDDWNFTAIDKCRSLVILQFEKEERQQEKEKSWLGKAVSWIKHQKPEDISGAVGAAVGIALLVGVVAGAIFLTLAFPAVMIPIWIVLGVGIALFLTVGAVVYISEVSHQMDLQEG